MSKITLEATSNDGKTRVVVSFQAKFTAVCKAINLIKMDLGNSEKPNAHSLGLGDLFLIGKTFIDSCGVTEIEEYNDGIKNEDVEMLQLLQYYIYSDEEFDIAPKLFTLASQKAMDMQSNIDISPIEEAKKKSTIKK